MNITNIKRNKIKYNLNFSPSLNGERAKPESELAGSCSDTVRVTGQGQGRGRTVSMAGTVRVTWE